MNILEGSYNKKYVEVLHLGLVLFLAITPLFGEVLIFIICIIVFINLIKKSVKFHYNKNKHTKIK